MSMSNGTGLTAADVAAVVDNNRGTYANDGFGFGGGNAGLLPDTHSTKHYGSADIGFRSKYYDRSP